MSKNEVFDAAVIGAGMAGCAAAHCFLGAGWNVVLLHRGPDTYGIESVPPDVARKLEARSIGAGTPFSEVIAWWGQESPSQMPCSGARIVQRAATAQQFRTHIVNSGGRVIPNQSGFAIERNGAHWQVRFQAPSGMRALRSRYIVDASGRASFVGRLLGARRQSVEHLYCLSSSFRNLEHIGVWTESVPDGWWNLCSDGREATLSFFSTAQFIREAQRDLAHHFSKTKHLASMITVSQLGRTTVRACGSSLLQPCAGPGWIAIGDAAMSFQPLASAGIAKALADAAKATDALKRPHRYIEQQRSTFHDYLSQLRSQYNAEARWSFYPFWIRPWGAQISATREIVRSEILEHAETSQYADS